MFSNANIKSAMNLDTPNEKRVTHHAFEQTYFTNDAIIGNNNYTFQFPETWSGLPTKKKAIGFRYAKRKVNSYYIWFNFCLLVTYARDDGGSSTLGPSYCPNGEIKLAVTNENSVEEVVHEVTKQMNAIIEKYNENVLSGSDYDRFRRSEIVGICQPSGKNDGSLSVIWTPRGSYTPSGLGASQKYTIGIMSSSNFEDGKKNFCKFFNQEEDILDYVVGYIKDEIAFDNVWDRRTLYIHSDFVNNTNYLLMDREGTFYRKPSKIYEHGYNGNVFHIWVSFDGKTRANLLHENVEIALTFYADVEDNYT